MNRNSYFSGLTIIVVGIFLLLGKIGVFDFIGSMIWPIFVLLPGLFFHFLFFAKGLPSGILVPGGLLTVYSFMFFYCNLFGWDSMSYLWPGFIMGVAIGLFEAYFFDPNKPKAAFIGSAILAIIAAIFFSFTLLMTSGIYIIALALIILGVAMVRRRPNN
ncbi:MAG: hypothetical protein WD424_00935 [Paenibacillaceae bacterium]